MHFAEASIYVMCGAMAMVCMYMYIKMKDDWK